MVALYRTLAWWLECSSMARETWVQSLVESYQRLKKRYLMPPCLTLSIITYGSRVKWSNPRKEVAPSPTPWCSSYRKRSLRVALDFGCPQLFRYSLCLNFNGKSLFSQLWVNHANAVLLQVWLWHYITHEDWCVIK